MTQDLTIAIIMLSTTTLEAAVVSEDEGYYHTLAQNLLSDHPICTQLTAHISDRVKWP